MHENKEAAFGSDQADVSQIHQNLRRMTTR